MQNKLNRSISTSLEGNAMIPALFIKTLIFFAPKKDFNLSLHVAMLSRLARSSGREATSTLLYYMKNIMKSVVCRECYLRT